MTGDEQCAVAIVGGGLAGALIAHALCHRHRGLRVRLVEPGPIGGNHIWSFFDSDVAARDRWIVAPFVTHRWQGYDVAFPGHARRLPTGYNSIRSGRLAMRLAQLLPAGTVVAQAAVDLTPTAVALADGRTLAAGAVIDARGVADLGTLDLGWQKFLGRELRLDRPHGLRRPVVMDATPVQDDGYRFVYTLPFAADRVFVEDTYYSDGPTLDPAALAARIDAYAAARGWTVAAVESEEAGALPVAMGGDFDAYWRSSGAGIAKAGMRAGLFHPLTGYSLPDAVRLAALIAGAPRHDSSGFCRLTRDFAEECWEKRAFYRLLARLLFRAAEPGERYRVLERFYRLRPGLIERFYAGRSTFVDKTCILAGKPPVPLDAAVRVLMETWR